ncbi:MAG: acylphosphatase [Candidatus Omnitrophica bacterium]|nr:acylphosphatase [Candidatus Omnitrophota bacterium]MDD5671777.1 acylphosphatase [Candidatus Omnitrophota bacterium]
MINTSKQSGIIDKRGRYRMQKKLVAIFSGTVQGVGFRFTTERIAKRFDVTGYVRNLPNGEVELVAEGDVEVLQDFLKAVRESGLAPYIRDMETNWSNAEGKFQRFGISF